MKITPFELAQLAVEFTKLDPLRYEPTHHLKDALRLLYRAERELQELNSAIRNSDLQKYLTTAATAPNRN